MRPARPSFRLLSSLGHGVNDLYFFVLPLVLPLLLKEFALSYRLAGLVLASYLGIIAVSSFVFGRFSDRFSPWILTGAGFLLASVGFLGAGLSPARAGVFSSLAAAAVGVGTFHPVAYALLARFSTGRPARAQASFEFWGIASILAMYLAGGLLQRWLGWRGVLAIVGVPGLAMSVLYFRALPAPAALPTGRGVALADAGGAGARVGPLLFFLGASALRFLSTTAVTNFMPTYLAMGRQLPPSLAAYVSGLLYVGGFTVLLWGRFTDRGAPMTVLLLATGLLAPLIFVFSLPLPIGAALPVLFLFGAFHSGGSPAQNLVLSALGSGFGSGAVFGLLLATLAIVGALSPALFGLLADRVGLAVAMRLFALPALAGWILLAVFRRAGSGRRPAGYGRPWRARPRG